MERLIVLGTGHAVVEECYNTCFALQNDQEYLLVDAGGGNRILKHLKEAKIPLTNIHHFFITHEHTDHLTGMVWVVRMISAMMKMGKYEGQLHIYAHTKLVEGIRLICEVMLSKQVNGLWGNQIILHPLEDGDTHEILGHTFTFFDILSTKAKQFGFTFINDNNEKIVCCGDEPYNEGCFSYVQNASWLLHEAFCLYEHRDLYKPYEKHHSTALDAGKLATSLNAKHLVLWHTEEDHLASRKELYTKEAATAFNGNIYVPYDLEVINLK